MSKKLLSLLLILPALTFCAPKASDNCSLKDIPEIHDADTVLATNVNVEKFLTEVSYPDTDYSFTIIFDYYGGYNESCTEEPDSDLPPVYCIRWNAEPGAGKLVFELKEPGAERTEILKRGSSCVSFTNLLPNTGYTFKVSSQKSGKVLTKGSFCTTGHLHQVWFKDNCRNARDLGGWTTTDGKTVKYRKIYRGGRMEKWTLSKLGGKEVLQEGIKAQLDATQKKEACQAEYDKCIAEQNANPNPPPVPVDCWEKANTKFPNIKKEINDAIEEQMGKGKGYFPQVNWVETLRRRKYNEQL